MPRIKITQPSMSSVGLGVEIDGRKIENIVALDYHTEPNFIPKITISTIGASEFDLNAEAIYLDVRPTNVNEAVVILQRELLKHKELYKSYRASIRRNGTRASSNV